MSGAPGAGLAGAPITYIGGLEAKERQFFSVRNVERRFPSGRGSVPDATSGTRW